MLFKSVRSSSRARWRVGSLVATSSALTWRKCDLFSRSNRSSSGLPLRAGAGEPEARGGASSISMRGASAPVRDGEMRIGYSDDDVRTAAAVVGTGLLRGEATGDDELVVSSDSERRLARECTLEMTASADCRHAAESHKCSATFFL